MSKTANIFYYISSFSLASLLSYGNSGASTPMPKTLTVAVSQSAPRWYETNGILEGYDYERMNELGRRLGLSIKIFQCPLKRCLQSLERGEADVMTGLRQDDTRKAFLNFLEPTTNFEVTDCFYKNKSNGKLSVKNYDDLKGKSIGVYLGAEYFKRFSDDKDLNKQSATSHLTNLRKLIAGRIDLLIGPKYKVEFLAKTNHLDTDITRTEYCNSQIMPVHFLAMAKKSKFSPFQAALEKGLRSMIDDGTFDKIENAYMQKFLLSTN